MSQSNLKRLFDNRQTVVEELRVESIRLYELIQEIITERNKIDLPESISHLNNPTNKKLVEFYNQELNSVQQLIVDIDIAIKFYTSPSRNYKLFQ